eukprot:5852058-Karenia_brevis.AAC.1
MVAQFNRAANALSKFQEPQPGGVEQAEWHCSKCGLEHHNPKLKRCRDPGCRYLRAEGLEKQKADTAGTQHNHTTTTTGAAHNRQTGAPPTIGGATVEKVGSFTYPVAKVTKVSGIARHTAELQALGIIAKEVARE